MESSVADAVTRKSAICGADGGMAASLRGLSYGRSLTLPRPALRAELEPIVMVGGSNPAIGTIRD